MKRVKWAGLALVSLAVAVSLLLTATPQVASAAFVVAPIFTAPVQAAGITETWTVSGWLGSSVSQITSATVIFPDGFVVPARPTVTVTAESRECQVNDVTTAGQAVLVSIVSACSALSASSNPTIMIAGVKNPATAGTKAAAGFILRTSVDGETRAASDVVIWGLTAEPSTCRVTATGSVAEARFTTTNRTAAANTGLIRPFVLRAATSFGSFVESPFASGLLATPYPSSVGIATAYGGVPASIPPSAVLVAGVSGLGVTGTATVTISATLVLDGMEFVPIASSEVRFAAGVCVPPAAAPAPTPAAGTFSGGTIVASGVSIVAFTGTTAQLGTAGAASKVVSVTATVGGKMLTVVVGAPAFVNTEFNAAFASGLSGALVIVKT